jgi:hypothetical protein
MKNKSSLLLGIAVLTLFWILDATAEKPDVPLTRYCLDGSKMIPGIPCKDGTKFEDTLTTPPMSKKTAAKQLVTKPNVQVKESKPSSTPSPKPVKASTPTPTPKK